METSTTANGAGAPFYDIERHVRELLAGRKGEWRSIADAAKVVSYSWITKFMNDEIPGPKVSTLRDLRDWLLANPPAADSTPAA